MKKILFLILSLLLMTGRLSGQSVFEVDGVSYRIVTDADESTTYGTVHVCAKPFERYEGDIVIPNAVKQGTEAYADTYRVTGIDPKAFSQCEDLKSVTLPPSIETLGEEAFSYSGLERIMIPYGNLTIIPEKAFYKTKLKEVVLPKSVVTLEDDAFAKSTLISFKADGLVTLGNGALASTELTSVTLPGTLVSLGDYAFQQCLELQGLVIPESVKSVGEGCFQGCQSLKDINLPDGLKELKARAFEGAGIEDLVIPSGIKVLRDRVFLFCASLKKVVLPAEMTRIDDGAFGRCPSLRSIVIPEKVKEIRYGAFSNCESLEHVYVLSKIPPSIDGTTFKDIPHLTVHVSPDALAAFQGAETWKDFAYEAYDFSRGDPNENEFKRTRINAQEYARYEGTSFEVPAGVRDIGDYAFAQSPDLEKMVLPSSVETLGRGVFFLCSRLRDIKFPSGLKEIGREAFSGCESLTSVVVPSGVSRIPSEAFFKCLGLKTVKLQAGLTEIEDHAFDGCVLIEEVVIPEGVKKIGPSAFAGCKDLKKITFPSTLESIGFEAFKGCESLREIDIPASVSWVDRAAFEQCSGLTKVIVRGSTEGWRLHVLSGCDNLQEIEIMGSDVSKLKGDFVSQYKKYIKLARSGGEQVVAVDLGLSVKWGDLNLGARIPSEPGDLFAWGETVARKDFSQEKYSFGGGYNYTKYCVEEVYGTVDNRKTLSKEDDAAAVILGGGWRMPTVEETQELIDKCKWEFVEAYGEIGNSGFKVTGPSGNSIFIPAESQGSFGSARIWTTSLGASTFGATPYGRVLDASRKKIGLSDRARNSGIPVRPVK